MKAKDTEREILQKAVEGLRKAANLDVQIQHGNYDFEAILQIRLYEMEWKFPVEVQKRVTFPALGVNFQRLRKLPQKVLLVMGYATPKMADRMREMGIQFIDAAGNAYINDPPLFIFIKGNRPAVMHLTERPTRAFQPKGLQVVFALLCNPGLEAEPFRKIADMANAALGTVGWVVQDLKQMGYLIDMGKRGRRLVKKRNLFDRWVATYPEQLRPKRFLGNYVTTDTDWWKDKELTQFGAFWGGEIAAAFLTKYLKPEIATIYVRETPAKLALAHGLKSNPKGNVEILKVFWNFEHRLQGDVPFHDNLVHPILIYADLLATGDTRNIETAEIIYEQELTRFIPDN
ncbi:MAG: hypothetical protein K8R45_04745 [Desulfobacterales bacterium]|nr:hypothetical protein [Desulfobacterales bacterium]